MEMPTKDLVRGLYEEEADEIADVMERAEDES